MRPPTAMAGEALDEVAAERNISANLATVLSSVSSRVWIVGMRLEDFIFDICFEEKNQWTLRVLLRIHRK